MLIEVEKLEAKGGIILTNDHYVLERGKVIAVGPDVREITPGVKVYYKTWALDTVVVGEDEYPFLDEKDALGIEV
jgi:co-chaperonin GroES (HSP10)